MMATAHVAIYSILAACHNLLPVTE